MSDTNILLITGEIAYRDPIKFWPDPVSGRQIPVVSLLLNSQRMNGKGVLGTEQFRVSIWDISDAQDCCLTSGTQLILQGQLKSRRLGSNGRGVLTAEITVKANMPNALSFGKFPREDVINVNELPDLLRQMGADLPPGLDQDIVAKAREAIANPAPPVTGNTPEMQYQ